MFIISSSVVAGVLVGALKFLVAVTGDEMYISIDFGGGCAYQCPQTLCCIFNW